MKRVRGQVGLIALELLEHEGPDPETEKQVNRWRKAERTRAAAWLVRKHRATIRRLGAFSVHVSGGKDAPTWFDWALVELRLRERSWQVEEKVGDDGGRRYVIRWVRRRSR